MTIRRFITHLTLLAGLLSVSSTLKASHILGGELSYTCVGTDSFLIHFVLYRDCEGISMPQSTDIEFTSSCGNIPVTVYLLPGSSNDITPLCPGWPSPCDTKSTVIPIGIERYEYEGLLIIPASSTCLQYYGYWSTCCRGSYSPHNSESFYIHTTLNRVPSGCNSSPRFLNDPVPFTCGWQEFIYNPGAYDPDGDSLEFSLVPCQTDSISYIHQQSPLNYLQPFHTAGPVTIDPHTGTIRFTPSSTQIGTYCIKVEEYRNGVLIGYTIRDITMIVVTCSNEPPTATGMNGTQKFDTAICPGQTLVFSVSSADPTPFQVVTMTGNDGIPGSVFTTTGGPYPVGTFTWTPTPADAGTHIFTVKVIDNGCPLVAQSTYGYLIEVRGSEIILPDTLAQCNGKPAVLEPGMVYQSLGFTHYQWAPQTGVANPSSLYTTFNPAVPTTYSLTAANAFCPPAIATMKVLPIYLSPTITQQQDTLVASPANLDYQWTRCVWRTHVPIPGATGPTFAPTESGIYAVIAENRHCRVASPCYKYTLPSEQKPTFPGQHSQNKRGADDEPSQALRVYPNPASGVLHMEVDVEGAYAYGLSLYTAAGQVVHQELFEAEAGNTMFTINISHLPAGLYLVALDGPEGRSLSKVVVME